MRRTKEDAEQTRQDLLDAALTIFSKKGYTATRLEDIAKVAGVTRGAIYHPICSWP
jgi:TetR/AcrR family acrAB operon transcriptional repressor